jgi:hypothetical protein
MLQTLLQRRDYACFSDTAAGMAAKPRTITCQLCSVSVRRNVDTLQKHIVSHGHKQAVQKAEKRTVADAISDEGGL